ncbi:hypothetical protein [Nonomuraea dietziae]|uniref:hypothetical protein n=1 Tax=Nonomuraea dietziae TaxID=65515 RepID=UPI0031D1ADEE
MNSSALQVGESVFSVVAVAITSALFVAADSGYWAVYAATLLMALVGLWVAPRFQTARVAAPAVAHMS